VTWVRATRSAASIPRGAFAALMPASGESGGVDLLARARDALVERGGGRRLVLCVDDGQLLDEASAALTHQLVAAGEAFAVVTVRRGERVPDALRALWKDELCTLVELDELSRAEAEQLLGAALGGPVDGRSASALWELALGNALFLRELVLYGIERGVLDESDGIWRWRGEVAAGTRLAELVEARLEVPEAGERGVLEGWQSARRWMPSCWNPPRSTRSRRWRPMVSSSTAWRAVAGRWTWRIRCTAR
jgi:hypothetical protein